VRGKNLEARLVSVSDKRFCALVRELEGECGRRFGKNARSVCQYPKEEIITACVMLKDGQAIACGAAYQRGEELAVLTCMYVKPEVRRQGLGRDIYETLELQALWQGCSAVGVGLYGGMKECSALFQKLGFAKSDPWNGGDRSLRYMTKDIE